MKSVKLGERWAFSHDVFKKHLGIVQIAILAAVPIGETLKPCPELGKIGSKNYCYLSYDTWKVLKNQDAPQELNV